MQKKNLNENFVMEVYNDEFELIPIELTEKITPFAENLKRDLGATPLKLDDLRPPPLQSQSDIQVTKNSFKSKKSNTQQLVGECHINFEKLLCNILTITNVVDNKGF